MKKWFQKDKFLEELNKNPNLYQEFFNRLVEVADESVWAKFILNSEFALSDEATKIIEKEEKKMEPIFKEGEKRKINQVVLLVAYLQYATADPLFDHEKKKNFWIDVVRNRKSIDSFPHHNAIADNLHKLGYIG